VNTRVAQYLIGEEEEAVVGTLLQCCTVLLHISSSNSCSFTFGGDQHLLALPLNIEKQHPHFLT
jgi:hypothetical protein